MIIHNGIETNIHDKKLQKSYRKIGGNPPIFLYLLDFMR